MADTEIERRFREALHDSVDAEIPSANLKASVESRIRDNPQALASVFHGIAVWGRSGY